MALKRGATQFEQQYDPHRMGNWELPDTPDSLPRQRHGSTRFIANDRGHLLESAARSRQSPWTPFRRTDTWEGPRRPLGPHSHSRPGYQNILRPPQGRQAVRESRENRPKGAVAAHQTDDTPADLTSSRPERQGTEADIPALVQLHVTGSVLSSPARSRRASRCSSSSSAAPVGLDRRRSGGRSPAAGSPAAGGVSPAQLNELRTLERERRAAQASPESPASPAPAIRPGEFARALRRENFSHWPIVETITDAALLAEPRPGEPCERTVAIRPLIHPGPTNCSKNVVVRPRTAPAPADVPAAKPPLLARRPTTALARKVPEIEYALCWNLPPPESADRAESGDSAASAASADSGVQTPRQAWLGPDSSQLTDRLRQLQQERPDSPPPGRLSVRESPEPRVTESGYGTPAVRRGRQQPSAVGGGGDRGAPGSTDGPTTGDGEERPPASMSARSLSSLGSRDGRGGQRESVEKAPRDDRTPVEQSDRGRQTQQSGGKERASERSNTPDSAADRPVNGLQRERTPQPSRVSRGDDVLPRAVCTCGPVRAASAPDLRGVTVSTQTAGKEPRESQGCRLDPGRKLRVRPCRACQLYRRQPRSVPAVKSDYRAALRAGSANWRPDVRPNVPQSRREPRLAVRRPDPPPAHRINTLTPPFAMWNDRRRDEYPGRDRLQTTYGLMNRSALQPRRAKSFQSLIYQ